MAADGDSTLGAGFPPELEPYREHIIAASEETGVPANLLAGVIWDESRGNLELSLRGGDMGLMQVNPNTFEDLRSRNPDLLGGDLADPATNIMAGALYLREQMEAFGSWEVGLRAYNSGPNNVNPDDLSDISAMGTGTANYVDKVMSYWEIIETGEGSLPA